MCWKWAPSPNNIAPKDLYYMLFLAPRSARSLLHINFGSEIFIYMSSVWLRDLYYMLFSRVETFISLGLVSLGLVSDQSIVGLQDVLRISLGWDPIGEPVSRTRLRVVYTLCKFAQGFNKSSLHTLISNFAKVNVERFLHHIEPGYFMDIRCLDVYMFRCLWI